MRISDWSSDVCSSDLPRGQTVAVVGESGSGKSTLARVITGLLPQSKGKVIFKGDALPPKFGDRSKLHLRQIQMLYQMADTAMNPRQTVRSEEHTSELQSLMRISYAVFCLKKKKPK